jgi:hypothetical protein
MIFDVYRGDFESIPTRANKLRDGCEASESPGRRVSPELRGAIRDLKIVEFIFSERRKRRAGGQTLDHESWMGRIVVGQRKTREFRYLPPQALRGGWNSVAALAINRNRELRIDSERSRRRFNLRWLGHQTKWASEHCDRTRQQTKQNSCTHSVTAVHPRFDKSA